MLKDLFVNKLSANRSVINPGDNFMIFFSRYKEICEKAVIKIEMILFRVAAAHGYKKIFEKVSFNHTFRHKLVNGSVGILLK